MKKKILITGGHGFLGSVLINKIKKKKYTLIYPNRKHYNLFNPSDVKKIFIENKNIHTVVHLASDHGGLYYNIKNAGSIYYHNVIMNTHLMHYSIINGVKKFISAGTVDSYPKKAKFPLKENDFWNGYPEPTSAAYSFSKKMMVVQGNAYKQKYKFHHTSLLFMNLYGPKDNFNQNDCHVIPAIINKIFYAKKKNKKKINLFGSGNQKREFLYIEDAAIALLKAINLPIKSDIINIGTGKVITIKKLADTIKKIMNFNGNICWNSKVNSGIFKKNFSTTISKKCLKFYPKFTLETGLKKTISWYTKELKSKIY
jgi:GDP-L-fucose synthase